MDKAQVQEKPAGLNGNKLRAYREGSGLAIFEWAERLGVHWNHIYMMERGERSDPKWSTLSSMAHGIAEVLGLPWREVLLELVSHDEA